MNPLLPGAKSANPFQLPAYYGAVGEIPNGTYWLVELDTGSRIMYWCDQYASDGVSTMWAHTPTYAAVFNKQEEAENAARARIPGFYEVQAQLKYREHIWGGEPVSL